jgi:hypothetical protein
VANSVMQHTPSPPHPTHCGGGDPAGLECRNRTRVHGGGESRWGDVSNDTNQGELGPYSWRAADHVSPGILGHVPGHERVQARASNLTRGLVAGGVDGGNTVGVAAGSVAAPVQLSDGC